MHWAGGDQVSNLSEKNTDRVFGNDKHARRRDSRCRGYLHTYTSTNESASRTSTLSRFHALMSVAVTARIV